jgi:hypothetical protein
MMRGPGRFLTGAGLFQAAFRFGGTSDICDSLAPDARLGKREGEKSLAPMPISRYLSRNTRNVDVLSFPVFDGRRARGVRNGFPVQTGEAPLEDAASLKLSFSGGERGKA